MLVTQPQVITPFCTGDGPTLTAAAAATCILGNSKITLPNNYWRLGRQWRLTHVRPHLVV
jgi:hypothetical protein